MSFKFPFSFGSFRRNFDQNHKKRLRMLHDARHSRNYCRSSFLAREKSDDKKYILFVKHLENIGWRLSVNWLKSVSLTATVSLETKELRTKFPRDPPQSVFKTTTKEKMPIELLLRFLSSSDGKDYYASFKNYENCLHSSYIFCEKPATKRQKPTKKP